MATHSSVLVWRIPGTEEPGGLPSMGSHRVGHDWRDLVAAAWTFNSLRLKGVIDCSSAGASPCEEEHTLFCLQESVSPQAKPGRAGTGCVYHLSVLPPTSQPRSASPSPCLLNSDCRTNLSVPGICVCPWACLWVFVLPGTLPSSPSLQLPPPLTPQNSVVPAQRQWHHLRSW